MSVKFQPVSGASKTLARVMRGDLCAGCGACAGLVPDKISMAVAPPAYERPVLSAPLSDAEDRLIAGICPGVGQSVSPNGRTDDTLWGPYVSMQTGHARDEALRFGASSGGALSALLVHLVASGAVDAVVQVSADPELPIGNVTRVSVSSEDIAHAAGSRYAPSSPLADLSGLKADGRRFAVVGKPCDVAALRALIGVDPGWGEVFPVLLSFFCAGVPSLSGAREVLGALGADEAQVEAFRYRGNGWPGEATATLADGATRSMSYHDSWGKILSKHVQHRCKLCADGTGMAADLVCADAWESDAEGYPIFSEAPGESLIVARTALGERLLHEAETGGALATAPFDVDSLAAIQPGQRERRRALLARLIGQRLAGRPVPRYTGLHIGAVARQNPVRRNLKNLLGTFRRALRMTG